jgi:hypothetical protein
MGGYRREKDKEAGRSIPGPVFAAAEPTTRGPVQSASRLAQPRPNYYRGMQMRARSRYRVYAQSYVCTAR